MRRGNPRLTHRSDQAGGIAVTKEQALDLIKLLSAVESWSFADKHRMPDYLYDKIDESIKALEKVVLN